MQALVTAARPVAVSRPECSNSLSAWLNETPSLVIGTTHMARWTPPGDPPAAIAAEARAVCAAFERYLAPGPAADIAGAIAVTLKMCGYDPELDESGGVDQAVMETWLLDLGDLPGWAVSSACAEWRRGVEKRPTPAGIRHLALRETERDRETLRRLRLTCGAASAA